MIRKTCAVSGREFVVTDEDLVFYEKMGVPVPTLCPDERQRRRLSWRNERVLFKRKCDKTGESIISIYPEDVPFSVYSKQYWQSDDFDPLEYGRDFDFSKNFFPQFKALLHDVPKQSLMQDGEIVNSDYAQFVGWLKDCYLVFDCGKSESCLHGNLMVYCNDCVDCTNVFNSELCYECTDCYDGYNLRFSQNCKSCSDSWLLKNCVGCKNCFGSVNLRQKEYCFMNEQLTKASYEKKIESLGLHEYSSVKSIRDQFFEFSQQFAYRGSEIVNCENCTGHELRNCKNTHRSFSCTDLEDCKFCYYVHSNTKFCYDCCTFGEDMSFCYETASCGGVLGSIGFTDCRFCTYCYYGGANLTYCFACHRNTQDCFGCTDLKKGKYCILNKQYSKEEYFELKDKIIEHMKVTGEWGEFFPIEDSPFPYNHTHAIEHFPLTEDEAVAQGLNWHEESSPQPLSQKERDLVVPDSIDDVEDEILSQVLYCELTGKPFKLVQLELDFYRKMQLPLPRLHPDQRHKSRMSFRNADRLWDRQCSECDIEITSSYPEARPEKILCEECYTRNVG